MGDGTEMAGDRETAGRTGPPGGTGEAPGGRAWTFLTNHGHVIVYLTGSPDARIRDVADGVGITERAAQGILRDLVEAGYVTATRVGRRNTYRINASLPLRHPREADHTVGELLAVFGPASAPVETPAGSAQPSGAGPAQPSGATASSPAQPPS